MAATWQAEVEGALQAAAAEAAGGFLAGFEGRGGAGGDPGSGDDLLRFRHGLLGEVACVVEVFERVEDLGRVHVDAGGFDDGVDVAAGDDVLVGVHDVEAEGEPVAGVGEHGGRHGRGEAHGPHAIGGVAAGGDGGFRVAACRSASGVAVPGEFASQAMQVIHVAAAVGDVESEDPPVRVSGVEPDEGRVVVGEVDGDGAVSFDLHEGSPYACVVCLTNVPSVKVQVPVRSVMATVSPRVMLVGP